eukprot:6474795-Pyramimonas_sp.AAC.1
MCTTNRSYRAQACLLLATARYTVAKETPGNSNKRILRGNLVCAYSRSLHLCAKQRPLRTLGTRAGGPRVPPPPTQQPGCTVADWMTGCRARACWR